MVTDLRKAAEQALEALETVTKQMLKVRDELAERGARPVTNKAHQALWDSSFASYTDAALPAATALREALSSSKDSSALAKPAVPKVNTQEASALIDSVLAEYNWPSNPKNAARAGYEAACRTSSEAGAAVRRGD